MMLDDVCMRVRLIPVNVIDRSLGNPGYMEVPNWKILTSIYGEAHIRGLLTCDLL